MDEISMAIKLGREALIFSLMISAPILITGTVVGILISVVQTATSIQEQTLTFVPKILIVVGLLIAIMPWLLHRMMTYTFGLFQLIPVLGK